MPIDAIEDPNRFDSLCKALLDMEYAPTFVVVDDAGGDAGLDGFAPDEKMLFAAYCPRSRTQGPAIVRKARKDLEKACRLRDESGYEADTWVFVTPRNLREPVLRKIREAGEQAGFKVLCWGRTRLTALWLKHTTLHPLFPELSVVDNSKKLDAVLDLLREHLREESIRDAASRTTPDSVTATRRPEGGQPAATDELLRLLRRFNCGDADLDDLDLAATTLSSNDDRLLVRVVLLDHLNIHSDQATLEVRAAQVQTEAEERELPRFALLARIRLYEIASWRFFQADARGVLPAMVGILDPKTRNELGEESTRLRREIHGILTDVVALQDPRLALLALHAAAFSNQHHAGLVRIAGGGPDEWQPSQQRAMHAYDLAVSLATGMGDPESKLSALYNYAVACSGWGDCKKAAALASAVDRQASDAGLRLPDGVREMLDGLMEAAESDAP